MKAKLYQAAGLAIVVVVSIIYIQSMGGRGSADVTTSVRLDAKKLGVFGLPDKAAGDDLGVAWTRHALPQWINYLSDSDKRKVQTKLDKLKGVNVVATIRAINPDKNTCHVDKAELEGYTGRTVSDEDWQKAVALSSCMPNDMNEYRAWVRQTVSELKGKVAVWQIENEVYATGARFWWGDELGEFDNFIALFRATSEEIKKADPGKPIMAAGIALGMVQEFDSNGFAIKSNDPKTARGQPVVEANVKRLLAENCNDFDISDIHLYSTLESILNRVKWLQRLMKETGCVKPIWTTETAGPIYTNPAYKGTITAENLPQKQAEDLPLRLKTILDSGLERALWFIYQDHPDGADAMLRTMGLLDAKGAKKPAYFAFQQVTGVAESSTTGGGTTVKPGNNSDDKFDWGTFIGSIFGIFGGGGSQKPPTTGPPTTKPSANTSTGSGGTVSYIPKGVGSYGATGPVAVIPPGKAANIGQIVASIFRIAIVVSGAVFLVLLLLGGITYLTSAGNEEGTAKGKKMMLNALVGLIIVLAAYGAGVFLLRAIGFKIK